METSIHIYDRVGKLALLVRWSVQNYQKSELLAEVFEMRHKSSMMKKNWEVNSRVLQR